MISVIVEESYMVCQKGRYMCSVEFDVTSGRRPETFNGESKYPCKLT